MNARRFVTPLLLAAALLVAVLAGIGTGDSFKTSGSLWGQRASASARTVLGPPVTFGGGEAQTFITHDAKGQPTTLGVVLSAAALEYPPTHSTHHGDVETVVEGGMSTIAFPITLALPTDAEHAPFTHVSLGWNPQGHAPRGIYDRPHFDLHFYMVSEADVRAIDPADPAFEVKAAKSKTIRAEYVPARYVATPDPIPRMGVHWVDAASPELNGKPFTTTFLYGFSDGKMNFVEPMITTAYLESVRRTPGQVVRFDVQQPKTFEIPGAYPTAYSVRYDSDQDEYIIALEGLQQRRPTHLASG